MNRVTATAGARVAVVVILATTAYVVYTFASLDGRQADARETAYEEGYAIGRPQGYNAGYDERYPAAYSSGHDDIYTESEERGYEEAYPLGLDEGRIEGHDSGYSDGVDDGRAEKYEAGYTYGKAVGRNKGYEEAFPDGQEDGREVGLATRVDLRNPTYWEMRGFLMNDWTQTTVYDLNNYNCVDYSIDVVNNAEAQGIRAAIVLLEYNEPTGHAIVAFDTTDRGLVFVEPQSDLTVYPVVGKRYQDCIPLLPGYEYPPSLPNDVIESIEVIW